MIDLKKKNIVLASAPNFGTPPLRRLKNTLPEPRSKFAEIFIPCSFLTSWYPAPATNGPKNGDRTASTYQTDYGSQREQVTVNGNEAKSTTESIISSYGVGPTDENGRPLFGLKALRTSSETKFTEEGTRDF